MNLENWYSSIFFAFWKFTQNVKCVFFKCYCIMQKMYHLSLDEVCRNFNQYCFTIIIIFLLLFIFSVFKQIFHNDSQGLQKKLAAMELKQERLVQAFKAKSKEMRELVYRLTGYLVISGANIFVYLL